ncbi:MAG: hypothetical protein ACK5MR_04035 [Cumulibacter sp.]
MAATTTIKVSTEVRDRLNSAASVRGVTPGVLVEELIADYERARWFEAIRDRYDALPDEDDYVTETSAWDVTAGDGLADG